VLERPVGGKTGTTNESRDAWFCGFSADYTCAVWVGYRDNRTLGSGGDYTGGRLACPIWVDFMREAHEGLPAKDFEVPPGIEFFNINRRTGTKGGDYREAYIAGTAPPAYKPPPPPTPVPEQTPAAPDGAGQAPSPAAPAASATPTPAPVAPAPLVPAPAAPPAATTPPSG